MKEQFDLEKLKFPIGNFESPIKISENDIEKWVSTIATFPEKVKNITQNLTLEELNYIYRPNGWTIKQVVHHCSDSHINAFIRFKLTLTESLPTIKPYLEAQWANLVDGNSNEIEMSVKIIEAIHYKWCLLLKTLDKNQLARQYYHPENQKKVSLAQALALYDWHCNHHFAHIEQALLFKNLWH